MRIEIAVDARAVHVWQIELAHRLREAGHSVSLSMRTAALPMDGIGFVGRLESRLYRFPDRHATAVVDAAEANALSMNLGDQQADLTIDTIGAFGGAVAAGALMTAVWDDGAGEAAAIRSLLDQEAPALSVVFKASPGAPTARIGQGLPGLEERDILTRSFDRVCERMGDLLFRCCGELARGALQPVPSAPPQNAPSADLSKALLFSTSTVLRRIALRIVRPLVQDEHWRLGWRRTQGDGIDETLAQPPGGYTFLPDDKARFFADPFVIERNGVSHVFCEEFPYATHKGVISHFTVDAQGGHSQPRIVLERPYHLSYPFLFERDGEIFMIPETSGNGTIELYRANPFPDVWKLDRVLVDNVRAGDATLVEHNGLFWIFATLADGARSTWDTLGIFFAEKLEGPWRPHPANPVLIDAGCARPAGNFFHSGGELIRPAQDCRGGYGAGLALCRVDRLDPEGFAQTVIRRFGPDPSWHGKGFHTLNRSGSLEVIDTKGWLRRF